MFGIFMESLVIFKLYTGLKLLLLLTLVSLLYLLITEKDKTIRQLFVCAPVLILLLFLFPVSRKLFVAMGLDGETYYRVLWTIPMGMITAYGAVKFTGRHRRIGLVVSMALIVLCGSYVYKSDYISKAENLYHIPETVVKICDLIHPSDADPAVQVTAVFPEELVHFVRQYDSDIRMPYGREMIASQWDYYNKVHEAMEEDEILDPEKLVEACREEYCQYIILSESRKVTEDPEKAGLTLVGKMDGYLIYLDPVSQAAAESFAVYYEEDDK